MHKLGPSFDQDEVTIEPGEAVVSVLASATLLLLDGLTAQCVALMAETVNVRNVLAYLGAAKMYGQRELEEVSEMSVNFQILTQSQTLKLREDTSFIFL